ncbi:uncharacterized protein ACA1_230580 [Acanthamoeba castellanii str. Neff]|uniref:FHA domain containing protein n=1 Tax=Acanthamoeba castellanii (strain ATCC 30010 / Neff) TaxID=1257118 RepID=L8HBB3_ACACF|nr:uncharacterized protein ACA1_230580 [Acanthamoeba castellanii str. Neff]ELR21671.1 hypothetical protein ACA1_230580 [Acanthamoeba castellanii str. Neff]
MELVEPLLLTISNVKELVQSHAEISNEVSDLGETILLIETAIRPLGSSGNDDPHLKDVLRALQLSMVNAKTALEKVATATTISQRVMSWFRSSTDLSELKSHQEKLKTLCPILSLAITTSQQNKNKGGAGADQEFNAMRLVKNEETKRFWAHHFGPKTFKVTWDQFRAAFEHEFEAQRDSNIELLRQRLDRNNDGDVDIYELATFTGQLSVLDSYQQLVEQHGQRRQQQQQQQQTQRVKRPAPRGDEQERRASEKEPVNRKPRTEDLDKSVCESVLEALNLLGTFGSGNGTFINGKRLTKSKKMLLHSGDQIGIVTDKERLLCIMQRHRRQSGAALFPVIFMFATVVGLALFTLLLFLSFSNLVLFVFSITILRDQPHRQVAGTGPVGITSTSAFSAVLASSLQQLTNNDNDS